MTTRVDLAELRRLLDAGAQLLEVLPDEEYREAHLPGAVHMPLKELESRAERELDRERPVVTYCWDYLCDLSPRAARRLVSLGFTQVYEYKAGKVDWLANNLPVEGEDASVLTAGKAARHDVATVNPTDTVTTARERVTGSPYRFGLVVDEQEVLLGRLRHDVLNVSGGRTPVERVMEAGPVTLRPNIRADELVEHMRHKSLTYVIITNPEGRLLGIVRRGDLERRLAGLPPEASQPVGDSAPHPARQPAGWPARSGVTTASRTTGQEAGDRARQPAGAPETQPASGAPGQPAGAPDNQPARRMSHEH